MEGNKMEKHVTTVGVLHIGLGVLGIMVALIVLASTIGPGLLVLSLEGEELPLTILTTVGCGVAFFLILISVPGIVGGIGLLKWQPWARVLVMIIAFLDLLNVPIGTAVGVYTIWALMQDETAQLFEPGSSQ